MRKRGNQLLILLCLIGAGLLIPATPALAHCHAFSFGRSLYTVVESVGHVTISVSRDGSYADSSVQYSTIDQTAKAGEDYTAKSGTISYTGTELTKQISIPILDDSKHESKETFKVTLHDAAGCSRFHQYEYGSPTTVSIQDNDKLIVPAPTPTSHSRGETPAPSHSPAPTTTQAPIESSAVTPSGTTSPSTSPSASPTPSQTSILAAEPPTAKGGLSGGGLAGIVIAVIVVGGVAALVVRERLLN